MFGRFLEGLEALGQAVRTVHGTLARAPRSGPARPAPAEAYAAGRRLVDALHPKRMSLRVTEVIPETATTKTFRFAREDGALPPFRAGQYINLYLTVDGVRTSRPYSISSAPGGEYLDLTVRDVPGGFVAPHLLATVQAGDRFTTSGPAGSFYHEPLIDGDDLVFLAGGSGITPFMSALRAQAAEGWPCRVILLYGSRVPKDIVFDKELKKLARGNDRFTYVPVISEPPKSFRGRKGFLDAKRITKEVGDVAGKTFYLCGPGVMYDFCLPELVTLGVPAHKIKRELYGPPADVTQYPGWPDELKASTKFTVCANGTSFESPAGEPLLNALERHGVVVPTLCRSGECSACRTRVVAGEVFVPPGVGVRESDRDRGFIHACMAYPISDVELKL